MHWTTLLALLSLTKGTTSLEAPEITRILTKFTPDCPSKDSPSHAYDLNEEFTAALNVRTGICQGIPVPMPLGYFDEVDHVSVKLEILENSHETEQTATETEPETETETQTEPEEYSYSFSASITRPSPTAPAVHSSKTTISATHYDGVQAIQWKKDTQKRAPNLEVCTVRLYEAPGCQGAPLIQREFGVGAGVGGETKCVTRSPKYMGLGEMFLRLDCADGNLPHVHPALNRGNATENANGTHAPAAGLHRGNETAGAGAGFAGHGNGNGTAVRARDAMLGKWQRRRMALLGQ